MTKLVALIALCLLVVGCGSTSKDLSDLSEEFVNTSLSFSPSAATAAGLHTYKKLNLDAMLDDMSPAMFDKQRLFYQDMFDRLGKLPAAKLTPEDRADVTMMQHRCELAVLDLVEIQSFAHNPALYVETLGNALFTPFVLEYAPKEQRLQHIIARLQKTPLLLDQATTNLTTAPLVWTQIAETENQGNIDLVDKTIRAGVPDDLRDAYSRAAQPALNAMRKFQDFLTRNLSARDADWRLGPDRYTRKLRYSMEGGMEADNLLEAATKDLAQLRAHMLQLALPLHERIAPGHHDHSDLSGDARQNQVIGEVLAYIAGHHSTRDSYLNDARKFLDEARAFVQQKHLLTLPSLANLQVVPTPEFMRGVYTAAGFNPAPPLEPQLGAFYWVTPIPDNWTKEQVDSKLREYNDYMLQLVTIHEAMPGHYVQFAIASRLLPASRRILRSLYGNDPYIEGWGQYAEQAMIEEGYLNHSPELELTFAKQQLRVMANAILDVRMQMLNMSDQDALDLLEKQAFQEHQEAVEKIQRAKMTSAQLPSYYVGWNAWLKARDAYKQAKGSSFNLSEFHDRALQEGAVPISALPGLLTQPAKQP